MLKTKCEVTDDKGWKAHRSKVSYIEASEKALNDVNDFINNSGFNLTKEQKEAVVCYAFSCSMLAAEDIPQLDTPDCRLDLPYEF